MKARLLTILCLLCTFTGIMAQGNYSVKGTVTDSLTLEPEPYATIRIMLKLASDKPVKMGVTNNDGKFSLPLTEAGEYHISISSVGKTTIERDFSLNDRQAVIDLGALYTADDTKELNAVEVVAQKPLVKADVDKITYSIEDDPDSQTNTTLEMLRKVPLVTIDANENIQVNGSSSFKVYVNGKPNTMMSNNPKEVLRSLPANTVKSIEVITDPGARYDAEGISGILNIVTAKDRRMQGYNATLTAGVNTQGADIGAYATVQSGKLTLTGNYSYNHIIQPRSYNSSEREDFTSETMHTLKSSGNYKPKGNLQFASIEGSYEIDTMNLITLSGMMYGGLIKYPMQRSYAMSDRMGHPVYSYSSLNNIKSSYTSLNMSLDYQHSFKRKGEYLTLSYKLDHSPDDSDSDTEYEDIADVPFELHNQYYESKTHSTEHTGQIDYVNPISEKHYIDFGGKYIYRINATDTKMYYSGQGQELLPVDDQSTEYDQTRNIIAAYADYQLKLKKLSFKAGARFEHSFMDVKYARLADRDFDASFNDLVPSAALTYMIDEKSNLRLNYNMRINRPSIWYLNPFRDTSNPTSISYGNPELDTEKAHNISLRYSYFSAKFSVNATLTYALVNNSIEQYSLMKNGIMETTYGNIGKWQRTMLSLYLNWNPGSKTRISINASGRYSDYNSPELNTRNSGFSGSVSGNIQQTLPWKLRLSVNGSVSTGGTSLQGTSGGYGYYGVSLRRSFLKDNSLTLSMNATNPFNRYMTVTEDQHTDTFRQHTVGKNYMRQFGISVSWRFGKLNAQVKHTARSIQNDDVKTGGNSSNTSLH